MTDTDPRSTKELPGDWYRNIAATYRNIAEESGWAPRRAANFAEAAKYEALGARVDMVQTR